MVETKLYKADKSWHPHYRGHILNHSNNHPVPRDGRITLWTVIKCMFGPRHTFMTLLKIVTLIALCVTCFFNLKLIFETKNRLEQEQLLHESDYIYKSHHLEEEYFVSNDVDTINVENHFIHLKVISSKDLVKIVINNDTMHVADSDEGRGIHLVVVNQHNGRAMSTKVFDTFVEYQSEALTKFIESISDQQRILIFAVKEEASFNLKQSSRDKLKSLGSKMIEDLNWRGMWLMICTKSGILFDEKISQSEDTASWAKPVTSQITISTKDLNQDVCDWNTNEETRKRRVFCSKYEGYGNLCICENPQPLFIQSAKIENNLLANIPITVIASNRPQYLYRMLVSLLSAYGVNKEMIIVFIDGLFQETKDVCGLFDVRSIMHDPIGVNNARISQHYKASLAATFNIYLNAQFALILEDDLQVSPDIISYFSQTLPLLERDPTLYCISAWNDQGYEHSSHNPSLLYRVDTMPGLGWLLKRSIFKELEPKWPTPEKQWDWDMWMRHDSNRLGRECVIPDVSRTFHFGESGVNMNPHFFQMYFQNHVLNQQENVVLHNVEQLEDSSYERLIHSLIRDGVELDHDLTPCDENFIDVTTHDDSHTYIAYFSMEDGSTSTFQSILKCLKLFDLEPRGLHKASFRTFIKGRHVIFVGYPISPYIVYKQIDIEPIFLEYTSETK